MSNLSCLVFPQYFLDHSNNDSVTCEERRLERFPSLAQVPDDFEYNGLVNILGFTCQDWIYKFEENTAKRGFDTHRTDNAIYKHVTLSHASRAQTSKESNWPSIC